LQGIGTSVLSSGKDLERLAEEVSEEHDWALVKHLREKVAPIDFGSVAKSLGARWDRDDPEILWLRYLGRDVRLGKSDVLLGNDKAVDPRDQILLYNYVHSGGGTKPDGTWIGMESLPNSISKVKTLSTYCERRIAGFLSGKTTQLLSDLGVRLDGYRGPAELGATATASIVVPVLPMVPQYLLFWEEDIDVGVEPKVKVLFDHNVLEFLDLESLVFSAERMAERLIGLVE
jgi:hypothetical protein